MSTVDVDSLAPFPAAALVWEAQPGQLSLTVIVKATFTLAPGEAVVAPAQDPLGEERNWDDNGLASLHWPGDFAPSKRRVDVMLVGHAHAPEGAPAASLVARLGVGEWSKAVRVTGDRAWVAGSDGRLQPGPPAPFQKLPLRHERASLSADNPIGMDTHALSAMAAPGGTALPNLEDVEGGDSVPCFGPVAPTWRARRRLLDESATLWAYGVARDPRSGGPPVGPAPRIDFSFFNAAPPDQQIDLLRPGTPIVLENLHPQHARLETRLPAIRPQVFRVPPPDTPRARVEEIILRADTLWIDSDRGVATVTWRGLSDVGRSADGIGSVVVAADLSGKKLRWEQVAKRLGERNAPTLRLRADGLMTPEEPDEGPPLDPLSVRHDAVKGQPAPEPAGVPVLDDSPTDPIDPSDAPTFPGHALRGPKIERPGEDERTQALPELSRPPTKPRRAPVVVPVPKGAPPPVGAEPPSSRPANARPIMAMGAPLGRPVIGGSPAPSPVPRPSPTRGPGPALRKDLTVQRCADIAASLAMRGADRAAVLRAHLLTEPAWAMIEQHWKKAIAREAETGGHATADLFDDAYVAAHERLRGPLDVAAYGRLVVRVERGDAGAALDELGLSQDGLVRLQRVWARRVSASAELAAALDQALSVARSQVGSR